MMNRRTLIPLVGGAFLALPLQVRAQQPGRTSCGASGLSKGKT
jgi:hypothetical protein